MIYSFKFRARNLIGWSDFSELLRVGVGNQVLPPSQLTGDIYQATATTLTLNWSIVQDADLVTNGYWLEMQNDDDTWSQVFEAINNPNALRATVYGLKTAKLYSFRVYAVDFNGNSKPSNVYQIYACGLPRFLDAPRYVRSNQTTITI